MSVIVKIENWLAKSVRLKNSSTYRIEKSKTEKNNAASRQSSRRSRSTRVENRSINSELVNLLNPTNKRK
jgi:hypothetical protein